MTTPPAVPVNTSYTESSARGRQTYAQVSYLGAFSVAPADPHVGAPEAEIDLDSAARTLLAARNVEEVDSPTVAVGSPFGI